MFRVGNRVQMVVAALSVSLLSLAAMMAHVHINYDSAMREIVRTKAAISTLIVSFPMALVVMYQILKNHRLSEELQRLVDRDRLTNVATRDYFFHRMEVAPDSFGVSLMVDIDHFKRINDTYGHLFGDKVIHRVASVLQNCVRPSDIVCRFGGEEFLVFLANHKESDGFAVAERIRSAIEAEMLECDGLKVRVTVSIGASLKEHLTEIEHSIQEADEALYLAKAAGRNQTVFHTHKAAA